MEGAEEDTGEGGGSQLGIDGMGTGFSAAATLTLPPAVAKFPEAASLTQPVEPLLLDELQDLRLNSLPQLSAAERERDRAG